MIRRSMLVALVVIVAAACTSTPDIHYYTLDLRASGEARTECPVTMERFRVSDPLARSQILVQAAPTRIEYYATDEWAGNLGAMVAKKLGAELGADGHAEPAFQVGGTVLECGQVDAGDATEARMALQIIARTMDGQVVLKRVYHHTESARGASAAAVVEALSRAAEAIATDLAEDLDRACTTAGGGPQ
jgi:uncharacterized lipoprotein YmbA